MRIHWNRIAQRCLAALTAGMIAASTLAGGSITAHAASTGSLTITPKVGDTEVSASDYDGTFKVYKVADYDEDGTFTATADFQFDNNESLLTGENLSDDEGFKNATLAAADWLNAHTTIEAICTGIKAGSKVEPLGYGLYLIHQDSSATNYTDTTPFLVMIPTYADSQTQTAVTAYPKITKVETPVTPPETPDKPHKPHDDTPPVTPPVIPPEVPETPETPDTPEEETPPSDDTGNMDENGNLYDENGNLIDENGNIIEGGATGDESNMVLYGVAAGAAVVALAGWFVWNRRKTGK